MEEEKVLHKSMALKIVRIVLGLVYILLGMNGLYMHLAVGYNPDNALINMYNESFRNLFNALMASEYIPITVRIVQAVAGLLLLTKKYWKVGNLLHLPIAYNILALHLLFDLPPANIPFFLVGMLASVPNIVLFFISLKDGLPQAIIKQ